MSSGLFRFFCTRRIVRLDTVDFGLGGEVLDLGLREIVLVTLQFGWIINQIE